MLNKKPLKKKGFTIVELVIVIVIIAILAAVLIPTFAGIVNKAKLTADQQTVSGINSTLTVEENSSGKKPSDLQEVYKILSEGGYRIPAVPVASGYEFYWIPADNRVVLVKTDGENLVIVYPEDLAEKYNNNNPVLWYPLSGEICSHKNTKSIPFRITSNESEISYYHVNQCLDCEKILTDTYELHNTNGTNGECTVCGYKLSQIDTSGCDHKKDGKYYVDYVPVALENGGSDYHIAVCKICHKVVAEQIPHQFDDAGKCEACGYMQATQDEHTHVYTYDSNKNGTHTKICSVCGISSLENCIYVYMVSDEGVVSIECLYCGDEYLQSTHIHSYTYTSNNNGTHNRECVAPNCNDTEVNVNNIACSYGEIEEDENSKKYRECIYCGYKVYELKNGLIDGYYYKDDVLFTGTESDYEFEYGKLVLEVEGVENTDNYIDYDYDFDLTNVAEQYRTNEIVLKFNVENFNDENSEFQPGDYSNNHIKLTGFTDYKSTKAELSPDPNIAAAIKTLKDAVDSDKTEDILELIKQVYGIDDGFYPCATKSKQYTDYTNGDKEGSFTDYLKSHYGVKHLYQLLESSFDDIVCIYDPYKWPSSATYNGLLQGNTLENTDNNYIDPEYILLFWMVSYKYTYYNAITDDLDKVKSIANDQNSPDASNNFYKHCGIDWKKEVAQEYGCDIISEAELYEGISLNYYDEFYIFSAYHGFIMGNAFQGTSCPSQSFKITVSK